MTQHMESFSIDTPIEVDDGNVRAAVPTTSHIYLLLHTKALEDWAFRPPPQDDVRAPATAPSVVDLVKQVASFIPKRWLWADGPMAEYEERGPLLVETTDSEALLDHALREWAPADGVIVIGSEADLDTLAAHLRGLTQVTLPDKGKANFNFQSTMLEPWLSALGPPNRSQWLGPMRQLLWRTHWHRRAAWFRLEHPSGEASATEPGWLTLSASELAAFNRRMHDYFVVSLARELLEQSKYETFTLDQAIEQVREWIQRAAILNIQLDDDVRQFVLLHARYPEHCNSPEGKALLNDLNEPPSARLRNLAALIEEKGGSDD